MPYVIPTSVTEPLLLHGDALEELRKLPDASVDVCIADQPAGINFMGSSRRSAHPRRRRRRTSLRPSGRSLAFYEIDCD